MLDWDVALVPNPRMPSQRGIYTPEYQQKYRVRTVLSQLDSTVLRHWQSLTIVE